MLQAARRDYRGRDQRDMPPGGDMSLLHPHLKDSEPPQYNMILLNNLVHNEQRHSSPPTRHVPRRPGRHPNGIDAPLIDPHLEYGVGGGGVGGGGGGSGGESSALLSELLQHVRQINEEMHSRASSKDTDEHYKSEWRMVALVLDRILLIVFFIMTLFTCVTIFVNVPH